MGIISAFIVSSSALRSLNSALAETGNQGDWCSKWRYQASACEVNNWIWKENYTTGTSSSQISSV